MRAALPTDLLWLLMNATDAQLAWVKQTLKTMFAGKPLKDEFGPEPKYLIRQECIRRRNGKYDRTQVSTWRIWFRGEEILMPTLLATEILVFLIINQGKQFSASELTQIIRKCGTVDTPDVHRTEILHGTDGDEGETGDQRGRTGELTETDVIWDEARIAKAWKIINQLKEAISEHEAAGDRSSRAYLTFKTKLEEQQDLLMLNAKQVNGKWVPKEYQKGTAQKKADVIRKHIRQLLDTHLKKECRPLFDHLNDRSCLTYGMKNGYTPKPTIRWVVELKEPK